MHRFILCQNYMMLPLVLYPPYFEAVYCFICGRRRVAAARYRMICLVLFKIVHDMCPDYLSSMFTFKSSSVYGLWSSTQQNMRIPKHNNELFKGASQYSYIILWNNLPTNLRSASSLASFKCNLFKHIIAKHIFTDVCVFVS